MSRIRYPSESKEQPRLGCLALLALGIVLLVGGGALARELAETESGRLALGATFLVAVLVCVGSVMIPQCRKFK